MENVTLQRGLNEVVINKVQRMIQGKETGVRETMRRLEREGRIARDYVAPIGVELRRQERVPVITFAGGGELRMNMRQGAVVADARMTDTKIRAETILPAPITIWIRKQPYRQRAT